MPQQKKKTFPSHKISMSSSDITILIACVVALGLAGYLFSNAVKQSRISKENSLNGVNTAESYLSEPTLAARKPSLPEATLTPLPELEVMEAVFPIPAQYSQNGEKSELIVAVQVYPGHPDIVIPVDIDPDDKTSPSSNVTIGNKTYQLTITQARGGMYCPTEPCSKTGELVFQYPDEFMVWRDGTNTIYAITTGGVRLGEYRPDVIIIDGVSSQNEVEMWKQILKGASIRAKTP